MEIVGVAMRGCVTGNLEMARVRFGISSLLGCHAIRKLHFGRGAGGEGERGGGEERVRVRL